jgi:hypothetical protein
VCRYFDERDGAVMGNSHIGSIEYINPVHNSEPLLPADLFNPFHATTLAADLVLYHGINNLIALHAQSVGEPVAVADGLTGPPGIGVITIDAVEIGGEPSPLEEGAQEFDIFQNSSPLVLDLDGDGIETQGLPAGAFFDHAGDGFAELTGWVGADDGLLVLDRNGNGAVDHGGELFGNETILQDGRTATDGYQALAELDHDANGKVDAGDPVWSRLRIWRDADGNGASEAGELHALADVGSAPSAPRRRPPPSSTRAASEHRLVGTFTRSGATAGATADVWFRVARRYALPGERLPVPGDVATLPSLHGYGTVHDLHQAIVRDTSGGLKGLVEQFVAESDPAQRTALLREIVFHWTGSAEVDPDSRGPYFDARKLVALEHIYGEAFIGIEGTGNPNAEVGGLLEHTFQGVAELLYAHLMVQTHLRDLWASNVYVWDAAAGRVRGDLSGVIDQLLEGSPPIRWPAGLRSASLPGRSAGSASKRWWTTGPSGMRSPPRARISPGSSTRAARRSWWGRLEAMCSPAP